MINERIIHQIWIGPKPAPEEWMQTWKDKHSTWKIVRWDNEKVKNYSFVNQKLIDEYISHGIYHGAADIIGYQALYDYGGFVSQADSICLRPIDELMNIEEDCFTCYVNDEKKRNDSLMSNIISLCLGASKRCALMKKTMLQLKLRKKAIIDPWLSTGNWFLTKLIYDLKYPIKIYPNYYTLLKIYVNTNLLFLG